MFCLDSFPSPIQIPSHNKPSPEWRKMTEKDRKKKDVFVLALLMQEKDINKSGDIVSGTTKN